MERVAGLVWLGLFCAPDVPKSIEVKNLLQMLVLFVRYARLEIYIFKE